MKYIIISIIILINLYIITNIKEDFYTFFIPFLNTKEKNLKINNNKEVRDNINIGVIVKPTNLKLNEILKRIIENSIFFYFTIKIENTYNIIEDNIINSKLDIGILNVPYIYSKINNLFNNIEFICNFSTSTIYFLYNKKNLGRLNNIEDINSPITTLKYNHPLIKLLLPDNRLRFVNSNNDLINNILENKSNVIMFVDSNPSNIFKNILVKDIKNNIDIIRIDYKNLNKKLGNYIFYQDFIKIDENIVKHVKIRNLTHETIFFYNSFYCKSNYNSYIIYNFAKEMFKNIKLLDKNIVLNNFSFNPPFIKINKGAIKYFTEINLLSNIKNPRCGELLGKYKCNNNILKNIRNDI